MKLATIFVFNSLYDIFIVILPTNKRRTLMRTEASLSLFWGVNTLYSAITVKFSLHFFMSIPPSFMVLPVRILNS